MGTITVGEVLQFLLASAFTAWAGVILWIGNGLLTRIDRLTSEITKTDEKLSSYILQTETRLALLEDRLEMARRSH
jgi:hypothetical protein